MKYKPIMVVSLLLLCYILSLFVSMAKANPVDSWIDMEVVSFNGENILFNMQVNVRGDHIKDNMWIKIEQVSSSDSVFVEVWRGISEKIYDAGTNVTVFSYFYSYNSSYYSAEPKFRNYLIFPLDKHTLSFNLASSFNITLDEHPKVCKLPSQNYDGMFQASFTPTNEQPTMYTVTTSIQHSASFITGVSMMLGVTIIFLYALSFFLFVLIAKAYGRENSHKALSGIIGVSSAIIFFVPAFEIAFFSLKSPLPLVLSDLIMIILIPINVIAICLALFNIYRKKR